MNSNDNIILETTPAKDLFPINNHQLFKLNLFSFKLII